jgi:protein-tyrosine-phosphatase/predicted ATP-grasp superfamily ATP-dependent carboligase
MRARKALVLGDDTRSFLAIVRSLGRKGFEIHAAPLHFNAAARHSRYLAATHYLPLWMGDGAEWLDAVEKLLRAERFDVVIPCTEIGLLPLAQARARFAPLACLAIPDDDAIAVLFDKSATRDLAASLGIPVAQGRRLLARDDAAALVAEFGVPLMLKPRHSYTLANLASRGQVEAIRSADELARYLAHLNRDDYLIERFFAGHGVGISILASKGRVLQAFAHRRIRETRAGGSYYRVSIPLAPDLLGACERIAHALAYTGVAMFEFRQGDAGWVLLEVNARPWGSLPLPVALGVDFPFRWMQLLLDGVEAPPVTYPAGIYGRNPLPDTADLARSLIQAKAPALLWRRMAEFGPLLTGRERQDTLVWDDMGPGLLEIGAKVVSLSARIARRVPALRPLHRRLALARLRAALRARHGARARVVFVCAGNICRSPYAAAALAAHAVASQIDIASAGTLPRPGRAMPQAGRLAAAGKHDLAFHRSVHFCRDMAEAADLIVVFDERNHDSIAARTPHLRRRVILLGDLDATGPIADPFGGDQAAYASCHARIDHALAALADALLAAVE